jgi:hypothetical protein
MVPVPSIAGQTRCFDAQYSSHFSRADLCYKTFEAWPLHFARTGTPEVLIDDLYFMKSKLAGVIGQTVLPALALQIVNDLTGRGLSNINNSTALEKFNR